jgi:L-ascorbate metabolism protein UlaG (beta-lactamase superfamily)
VKVSWLGQSAFLLEAEVRIVIDPFGDVAPLRGRGLRFDYPEIRDVTADLVLVTHEHLDHNAVEVVGGTPATIRSTAGRFDSPAGEVVAVASEHDPVAGTQRGPNTIFSFTLGGLRVCHLGDLGQDELRPQQRAAIGAVDVLLVPVGDGPTIGGARAAAVVRDLEPGLVVPMHYRTDAIDFLEPPDAFLDALGASVTRLETSSFDAREALAAVPHGSVLLPSPPRL